MIETLITSQTRIKLLLKFFLNPETKAYLRQLARDFNESTNSVRSELNKMMQANLLVSEKSGRQILYTANREHPLFQDIHSIVMKSSGIDKVIGNILNHLGSLQKAFITGDYAIGKDAGLIDLVLVGDSINVQEVERVRLKTETIINRKIHPLILTIAEYQQLKQKFDSDKIFLLWENGRIKNG